MTVYARYLGRGNGRDYITGVPAGDLTREQYDALALDAQAALWSARREGGGPLYEAVPVPEERLAAPRSTKTPAEAAPADEDQPKSKGKRD